MFDKKYVLIDLNDVETPVDDLKELVESFGVSSMHNSFVLDIKKISWATRDDLFLKSRDEYYDYSITNKKGQFCSGCFCLRTLSGKKVHPNQVLSEYLDKYPNSAAAKKFFALIKRRNSWLKSSGSKSACKPHLHFRNIKGLKTVVRDRGRYEYFEGGRVRLQRQKLEERFSGFFEPYGDYFDYNYGERSWKNYRKTQYKSK